MFLCLLDHGQVITERGDPTLDEILDADGPTASAAE